MPTAADRRTPAARRTRARRGPTRLNLEALECRATPTTVVLGPCKDNTLYESPDGLLSNGAGAHFFAGTNAAGWARRGLLAFDVADSVPAGSTITGATLRLNVSRSTPGSGASRVSLYRVLADWGEGTSAAAGQEGEGAPATPGDATWVHRFFDTDLWSTPGGDFAESPRASTSVGGLGPYTWGSSSKTVEDVQAWLDDPANNFGWEVLGDESAPRMAKRFDTRENPTEANRPTLTIDYTEPKCVPIRVSGQVADIVARSGVGVPGQGFGTFRLFALSGLLFEDLNGNGVRDEGEPGLAGRTVLLDANGNGVLDPGEVSVTTGADGSYTFAGLGPGVYRVRQVLPDGWAQTTVDPADVFAVSGTDVFGQEFGSRRA
jgi:hypothetical protein